MTSNIKRRQQLGRAKQEKVKKRRIQLLKFRTKGAAECREWSKKHGGDTSDIRVWVRSILFTLALSMIIIQNYTE